MAIVHVVEPPIHPGEKGNIYAHLKHAIKYILKPEKTLGGLYTGSWNCGCGTALKEMAETKRQYGKEPDPSSADYEHDRIAYHVVISWSPGEAVLPEKAMEITRRFCEEYLPGYEAVYSAHLDTEHMHTHIIFNSVNYKTGRKYHFPADEWEKNIQPLIDRLCKAYGLRTLEEDTGKSIVEYTRERKEEKKNNSARKNRKHNGNYCYRKQQEDEYSISDYVRDDIDRLIESCGSFEEFVQKLQEQGYEIRYGESEKYGTYMKLRNVGMKRFRRTYTLGADYTVDMIKRRIEAYHEPLEKNAVEQEFAYLFVRRIYHVRIRHKTDNVYLRKQYARLYRLGIFPKHGKRPAYWEIKERIKNIHRLEYQIGMIMDHDYRTKEDLNMDIAAQEHRVAELKADLREQAKDRKPYENMIADYEKLAELEGAYLLVQDGMPEFQKEALTYERLKKKVAAFPFKKEELEKYLESCAEKKKDSLKKLSEEKKKLEALKELSEEYEEITETYAPAEKQELSDMEQHGAIDEENRRQRRNKRKEL